MRMLLAAVAAVLTSLACALPAWADAGVQPVGSVPIPDGPAQTWLVADLDSGQVLAERDANVQHPPASTIKVLLALVALDELSLDSTVVADEADSHVECACAGVKAGRSYTARQLLDGLLLVSGNDAANTLAHMLGGPDAAVAKMDAKAASLGAVNTHASTPSGLDGPGGSGWSTAHDLAVIFRAAMANPVFAEITGEPAAVFPGDNGDHAITNQDELLQRYPGAIGGKTGFTNAARKTFVGAAARGGRRLVVAMM
jgi:serine-type D-Ala-D-Ala carboxypeptidase (penicillin-binding protein 5/6)